MAQTTGTPSKTLVVNMASVQSCGDNVSTTVVDKYLVILVDTTAEFNPSATGKMLLGASTHGFSPVQLGLRMNLIVGKTNR